MRIKRHPRSFHSLSQKVVERSENIARCGMMAGRKFVELRLMAARAIARRDDRGNGMAVMVECVGIAFFRLMAFDAAHSLPRVSASFPMVNDAGRRLLVAIDAFARRRGNGDMGVGQP